MSKRLPQHKRKKTWTPERRARQAALIRRSKPWLHSTGPKTEAGKARASQNACKHGFRSRDHLLTAARIRRAFRRAALNLARVRAHFQIDMRSRSGTRKKVLTSPVWGVEPLQRVSAKRFGWGECSIRVCRSSLLFLPRVRGRSAQRAVRGDLYRPVHSGRRLPRNAVMPSLKSALP